MWEMKDELIGLSEYVFTARIRPRLDGVTDDEYFWEPVAGCWSVRPDVDGVFRTDTAPLADRAPFTTLAWRLWHLIGCYGSTRNGTWLGLDPGPGFGGYGPAPATAAAALEVLDAAYAWWSSLLHSITDDQLGEKLGPIGGEYAEATKAGFVLHQIDEVIHHGAEVALMRDLYRDMIHPPDREIAATVVDAAANGYWSEVGELVQAGADVNATRADDHNRTALHHAAAAAPLAVIRLLVERGADRSAKDTQFHADALGWAEYFDRPDVVDYLKSV